MKKVVYHLYTVLTGILVLAGHFMLAQWLFGQTFAIAYLVFQFVVGVWMVYELFRAPVYDD